MNINNEKFIEALKRCYAAEGKILPQEISKKIGPITFCDIHFNKLKHGSEEFTKKPMHFLKAMYLMWRIVEKAKKCPNCKIDGVDNARWSKNSKIDKKQFRRFRCFFSAYLHNRRNKR